MFADLCVTKLNAIRGGSDTLEAGQAALLGRAVGVPAITVHFPAREDAFPRMDAAAIALADLAARARTDAMSGAMAGAATGTDERMAKTGKPNSQTPRDDSSADPDAEQDAASPIDSRDDPRDDHREDPREDSHDESSDVANSTADSPVRRALESTLKDAAAGDQRAWRVLVETYSARVFGLIRAQSGSSDLAEEITQSTFCTVVAKIGDYTEVGKFEQWLFRIAMNRLRDEMRRRKRQARPVEDEALHAFADSGGSVGAGMSGGGSVDRNPAAASDDFFATGMADPEQLKALRAALAELPDSDQQIIHLRHNAGLSFKEIAEILEQPLGTVLARQHRALKKLAEVLKPAMGREASIGKGRRMPGAGGSGGGGGGAAGNQEESGDRLGGLGTQPSGP